MYKRGKFTCFTNRAKGLTSTAYSGLDKQQNSGSQLGPFKYYYNFFVPVFVECFKTM